jgi:putative nucleotidyltransferase with HDIG domain
MSSEPIADWIESVVLKRIADDTLVLPALPGVTLRCIEILRPADFSFKQVALALEKEPALVARVLRVTTSAAVGGSPKLELTEALARLGAKNVRTILFEAAARKVFLSKDPEIAATARKTWEHSIAVATLARDIAALSGSKNSEAAYLGGLLHDIGKPVVAMMLLEAERQVVTVRSQKWIVASMWNEVVSRAHRKVGAAIAEKWKLAPEICRCIRDCSEYDNSDRSSIVNAVCLANALAKLHGCATGPIDEEDLKALVMIGRSLLGVSDEVLKKLAAELPERMTGLFE